MTTLPCAIFFILVHKLTDIFRIIVEKCIVLIFSHYLQACLFISILIDMMYAALEHF